MTRSRLRDLLKSAIAFLGLSRAYARYRCLRGEDVSHLLLDDRADRFSRIYERGVWLNDRRSGALSGLGSELENTRSIRDELPGHLARLRVETLLDIGCGDWTWMKQVDLPCGYIGADIVPSVIARNQAAFPGPRRRFIVLDAVKDPLPPCDAIICREVLFHLSLADAASLLAHIVASPARYLFATTDRDTAHNIDIISGDFRLLNLQAAPFSLPPALHEIEDADVYKARRLCVWDLDQLRNAADHAAPTRTPVSTPRERGRVAV